MPARNRLPLTRLFAAATLLVLVAFPLRAHQIDPAVMSSSTLASSAVTATGTVSELIVENRISGVTLRYLALHLDEGQTVALTGAGLESLTNGARVEATGTMTSNVLAVNTFTVLPATQAARKADLSTQERKQLQGTLVVFHKDFFAQGRGEFGLGVYDGAKRMTPLNVPVVPDAVHPGMLVSVSGTTAADGAALDTSQITILGFPPPQATPAGAPVTNNVLVMPIKFSDSPAGDPFTGAAVDQAWRTNPRSVTAYYNEVSYGQQQLNVTVACVTGATPAGCAGNTSSGGWLVSSSPTPANCDFNAIGNLADQAAAAVGYTVANYQNRFYVMPNISCGWAGLAYIGYPYQAWSDAYNELWVYGHELGHNFNLYHAGSVNCSPQVFGGSCGVAEYGDRFDVMGNNANNNEQMHFNAAQKSLLHWLPAGTVVTHTSGTATYTLSPLESAGQTTYAVKIPVANDSNRTYWIEYRQPIGFDSGIAAYPNNGAQIRVASPFDYPCSGCGGDDTELLDMTPTSSGGFYDAALLAGQTYTDNTYGISVTVNSATPTALNITVSMGGATTTALASSANPSPVGVSVTFTATVTGSAPTGSVGFAADGVTLSGCGALALPTGTTNSKTVTCSTMILTAGTHSVVATYSGDASNSASASTALSQVVNPVGAPGALVNPSFEIPALSGGYQYNPSASGIGWNFGGGSGIQGNGSAWGAAVAPDGTQTAFVQGTGSISQTLNLNAGGYALSFQAAQRSCCVAPYVQPIQVSVDGVSVGSIVSPASTSFSSASIPLSIATTGTHTITFTGTDPSDKTTFIDIVTLASSNVVATTTTLVSSPNPSTVGSSVAFTATVAGSAPTGSVGFTADGATISGCAAVALGGANATCPISTLSVGTHNIVATYSGDASNLGSFNALALAQVVNSGSPPPSLVNSSFEIPTLGGGYQYNPSGSGIGWAFSSSSGIQGNGSAWGAAPAPDGSQTAFIQSTGAISQTLNLTAGSYTLSFQAAQRSCCVAPYVQAIKVSVDGTQVGSLVSPMSTTFSSFSIPFSVSTTGAHTITFTGADPSDKTTFIDNLMLQ